MVDVKNSKQKVAVILMTYGSPETLSLKDVHQYLKNVYGGRDPNHDNVAEFRRRYILVGGSPLIKITKAQAKALEKELAKQYGKEIEFKVAAGMRFSHPYIEDIINIIASDVSQVIGIIMSPQYSTIIMKGYIKELTDSVNKLEGKKPELKIATDWHKEPFFIKALAQRVQDALDNFSSDVRGDVPVLFSAHSMPKRVIEKEPNYIHDLKETASEVAKIINLPKKRWMFCYQSAGHTPEEWLKPDFADIIPKLQKKGQKNVLIAPVQFLADHLEILYDVGIGAREQAEKHDINFARTESLNTSPLFIKALANIVSKQLN